MPHCCCIADNTLPLKNTFSSFTAPWLFPDLQVAHMVEVSLSSIHQTFTRCDRVVFFQNYEFEACSKEAPDLYGYQTADLNS